MILRNKILFYRPFNYVFKQNFINMGILKWSQNSKFHINRAPFTAFTQKSIRNYTSKDDNKIISESNFKFDRDNIDEPEFSRFTVFNDWNNDYNIKKINACASAEDVFKFIDENSRILNDRYITQVVFVLRDLQVIFSKVSGLNSRHIFLQKLIENETFVHFLKIIENSIPIFDPNLLSLTTVYLARLGIPVEYEIIQNLSLKLKEHIMSEFSPKYAARLFKVIFKENSVRPYYIASEIFPQVVEKTGTCTDPEDLLHLTTCLNRMNVIMTESHLEQYKFKVNEMIDNKLITGDHLQLLLKILLLLNYPQWRDRNSLLISRCILLMKDSIDSLGVRELEILYDVFFKNQEPGEVLNSIQRLSAKHLQELEESDLFETDLKLKFFSSLVYFCSPTHRSKFRKDAGKYLQGCDNLRSLFILRKIYSYLKIADEDLCARYWDKILEIVKDEKSTYENFVDVVNNYMRFYTDIDNYRHFEIEIFIFKFLKKIIKDGSITLYPDKFFILFSFTLANVKNSEMINTFMKLFVDLQNQLSAIDCLRISHTVQLIQSDSRRRVPDKHLRQIKRILNQTSRKIFERDSDSNTATKLARGAIYRNSTENETFEEIVQTFKDVPYMSSKIMENLCHIFLSTGILIPEVLNNCTEYVVNNKSNVLGFNAEKILFICYFLNYYPVNNGKFFDTVTDIIIRDQERLSGLSFVQSVLSLCYFGRVSKSLVKQIFNVEFLEKLDIELANCYSRDTYPQRVRTSLMQLNRAVCLEYPEYHVPWFHQRYIEEAQRYIFKDDFRDVFHLRVKDYLVGVLGKEYIMENIVTPYGYEIDFVVNLDCEDRPLAKTEITSVATKLAILLWTEAKYTRMCTHLKGKYQMQIKHLEILGYKVKIIKLNQWMNLLYARERIDFIQNIVFK